MLDLTNQYFPKKILSKKQYKISKNPWISSDILKLIKEKNKLYSKYLKHKSPVVFAEYKNRPIPKTLPVYKIFF